MAFVSGTAKTSDGDNVAKSGTLDEEKGSGVLFRGLRWVVTRTAART